MIQRTSKGLSCHGFCALYSFIVGLLASCTSLGSVISSYDMVLVCAASLGSCS